MRPLIAYKMIVLSDMQRQGKSRRSDQKKDWDKSDGTCAGPAAGFAVSRASFLRKKVEQVFDFAACLEVNFFLLKIGGLFGINSVRTF